MDQESISLQIKNSGAEHVHSPDKNLQSGAAQQIYPYYHKPDKILYKVAVTKPDHPSCLY